MTQVTFEGLTADELLALSAAEFDALVFTTAPMVVRIGSAQLLCHFRKTSMDLIIELGHIEGGGEGVLPALSALAIRYARRSGLERLEWLVHATHCAQPNLKLQRMLKRRGFRIEDVMDIGVVYRQTVSVEGEVFPFTSLPDAVQFHFDTCEPV